MRHLFWEMSIDEASIWRDTAYFEVLSQRIWNPIQLMRSYLNLCGIQRLISIYLKMRHFMPLYLNVCGIQLDL